MNLSTESIDKWVRRQKNRPIVFGVHFPISRAYPGESTPGWYVRNNGNLETAKRIHAEELECIRILRARIERAWRDPE
jgi:hypothetical protein